ncbi:Eco57I restriction-modification methylase domain-containing protein [Mammaliicoccus sciuri]|uniref:Eco57I restriction-modification methylase domain-containing protein n=1 Tax=Mammaliicoccus sciuri TaxID=1296 RepID=UPI003F56A052
MVVKLKKELGQVFTPENIAYLMASFFQGKNYFDILDPAAGTGVLLDACIKVLGEETNLSAVEIDKDLLPLLSEKGYKPVHQDFFDFKRKVDGIIMNPPYIRQELLSSENHKLKLTEKISFKKISARANLYLYFLIKSLDVLKPGGRLVVIIPNTWLSSDYGVSVQSYILENYSLLKVVNFEKKVFKDVDVDVSIFVIDNTPPTEALTTNFYHFTDIDIDKINKIEQAHLLSNIKQNEILSTGWFFYKHKISFNYNLFSPLANFTNIRRGVTTNYNNFFIRNIGDEYLLESSKFFEKIVNKQTEISGYRVNYDSLRKMIFLGSKDIDSLPSEIVSEIKNTEELIKKNKKPKTLYNIIQKKKNWFSINPAQQESLIFNYIIRNEIRFILNDTSAVVKDNFYILTFDEKEIELVYLAVLNSSFSKYFIENCGRSYGNGLLKVQKYELEKLPVIDYVYLTKDDFSSLLSMAKSLITAETQDSFLCIISKIDAILEKYYLAESVNLQEFYSRLRSQIKGRLNNYD